MVGLRRGQAVENRLQDFPFVPQEIQDLRERATTLDQQRFNLEVHQPVTDIVPPLVAKN
jgi:hypothetical protein